MMDELIAWFCSVVRQSGYRVYLAESGRHGYYTDDEGTRVVSFQEYYSGISLSGNYVSDHPLQTGMGWKILDFVSTGNPRLCSKDVCDAFKAYPPHWAVGGSSWRFATQADHQGRYQVSSNFVEVCDEASD